MEFVMEGLSSNTNIIILISSVLGLFAWFIKYFKDIKKELMQQFERQSIKYETNFREIYQYMREMLEKHVDKKDIHKLIDINTNNIKENTQRIENLVSKIYNQK